MGCRLISGRHIMLAQFFAAIVTALGVPSAGAGELHSYEGRLAPGGGVAVFSPRGIRPGTVESARVRVGSVQQGLRESATERGVARARLRVRLTGAAAAAARRSTPRLLVQTRAFAEFDGFSARQGTIRRSSRRAYDGPTSLRARYRGGGNPIFQRAWRRVRWRTGTEVWYGMALYVTDRSAYCYWNPMRWDNYLSYGQGGDVGGLAVSEGRLELIRARYSGEEGELIDGGRLPTGRWVWLEVHQRLSGVDGEALSELFVDGRRRGTSTEANTFGRPINHLRFGAVNVAASCARPATIYFDRARVSSSRSGPLAAPSRP